MDFDSAKPVLDALAAPVQGLDTAQLVALAAALGFASGIRLYAVLLITGLAGYAGWVDLPAGLHLLQHPAFLAVSALLMGVEFFADKIPLVDSAWDAVHTFIRIPAGAALAAAVFGADQATFAAIAALVGGTLAATSHAAKATTRAAANTSPEPFSNVALSLAGDMAVPALLWLAVEHPVWFFIALAIALVVAIVLIRLLWKFLRAVVNRIEHLFTGDLSHGS
ncbi:DUF4126 domain-containing protein [Rivibacter subsaxonicus]|uniref:Uncharacterized protein DUF4126 n=1 Tax=Rivibacter subsaxonicus TaxID=457575 RepID=A0A4Q7VZ84_9BURK|nr:DUF4126 domain-containing protein [Rivibacter subsaxonicus]RZU02107.1 uncharacterized protein DUF4126 [Rivibacter subsaxonicus]